MITDRREFIRMSAAGAASVAGLPLVSGCQTPSVPAFARGLKALPPVLSNTEIRTSALAARGKAASFFIDDVIWFLRDISRQRPKSMFEHPFLAVLRECHEKWGLKVQLNLFYRTDFFYGCDEFTLAEVTDDYKAEWQANKGWLKLGFHSLQEFPDYPWVNIGYADVKKTFGMICGEIERFAGPGVFTTALVPHWGPMSKEGVRAMKDLGIKLMECTVGPRYEYDGDCNRLPYGHAMRLTQNRRPEVGFFWRDSRDTAIAASICSYNHLSEEQGLATENSFRYVHDRDTGMNFKRVFCDAPCLNLCTPEALREDTAKVIARDYLVFSVHEQYFYRDYLAYQPDYADKIRIMSRIVANDNRRFVLMEELV